jgi:hypothetical protein
MKPTLFIIGAPKCGTTSLAYYLDQEPSICMSIPKEPKFFHTDFSEKHRYALTLRDYERCFQHCSEKHQIAVESTVWYLFSEFAVPNILSYSPDAKFVVLLRDPVELVQALHSQLVFGGDEAETDFSRAWYLQEARRNGHNLPPNCRDPKSLQYRKIALLGEQVHRLLGHVDASRVKFVRFSEIVANPLAVHQEIMRFAALPSASVIDFAKKNENKVIRNKALANLLFWGNRIKLKLGLKRSFSIWLTLQPIISRKMHRPQISDQMLKALRESFEKDLELLRLETGIDLREEWN